MRWIFFSLAGSFGLSGASASFFEKKSDMHVEAGKALLLTDIKHAAFLEFEKRTETIFNLAARHLFHPRQDAGRCGADFGSARCPDNACCSAYGQYFLEKF
jgi:hypothetical protein